MKWGRVAFEAAYRLVHGRMSAARSARRPGHLISTRLPDVVVVASVGLALVAGCGGDGASQRRSTLEPPPAVAGEPGPHPEFYFYFEEEDAARRAAAVLEEKGYAVETTPPDAEITAWSVVAVGTPDAPDLVTAEDAMEPWAEALGGEYDGNAVAVGG